MDNNNVVKIGTALKWRNTFDLTKKYYQENVVTACGCVFRCKVLQAQGKSPIKMTDDQGHIVYTNTDVWDVLVDMAYYYNYAVDTRKLTQQMLDYAKALDKAFQEQQKEIEALQKDNKNQWNHINGIKKTNAEQQRELNSIFDTISCFSEGIWIDTLLWSNETIWDNNKYAITDDLQNQINELTVTHRQDIKDLTEKHNSEFNALSNHIVKQEKIQDKINSQLQNLIEEHDQQIIDLLDTLSCFSNGYWDNGLKWSNQALWENSNLMYDTFEDIYNKIAGHQKSIEDLTKNIQKVKTDAENTLNSIDETFAGFRKEHEGFRKEHKAITDRLDGHDTLCEEQQREIDSLLYRISILNNGIWDNVLLWNNDSEWTNTDLNGSCHCPEDTEDRLDELNNGLEAVKQCVFDNASEIENIKQDAVTEHRSVAYQLRAIGREQVTQDENLAKLGEHFSCYADGIWGDLFIWDNDLLWANQTGVVNEALTDLRNDLHDTCYKLNEAKEGIIANNQLIEENAVAIQEMLDDIRSYNGCFEKGEWANPFFWSDTDKWYNSPDVVSETETEIISHDSRLTALESQFALILQQIAAQQTIIEQQQTQLETFMDCFTVLNVGKWQNMLLWDNNSKWSDVLITEAAADGGIATVAVKSYDSETETVSI